MHCTSAYVSFFFFNDTATTEIYTLSLHDALPISAPATRRPATSTTPSSRPRGSSCSSSTPTRCRIRRSSRGPSATSGTSASRSEEHTSELQSRQYLVCRLLLEKKTTT